MRTSIPVQQSSRGKKSNASRCRVVKKLERLEMAWLRILHRLRFRMGFSDAETAPTISLSQSGVINYRGIQDALGTPARLCHRNSESRTPIAKRVSGGGEPDPERADQGSAAAFRWRKGDTSR